MDKKQPAVADDKRLVSDQDVVAFLRDHPDFLDRFPDLLRTLTPPSMQTGSEVADMQRFMVSRLRENIESLQGELGNLVFSCRDNLSAQDQVHRAVIKLMKAPDGASWLNVLSVELASHFAVDAVYLVVESDIAPEHVSVSGATSRKAARGVRYIKRGMLHDWFGLHPVLLGNEGAEALAPCFMPNQALIQSYALLGLHVPEHNADMAVAIGSRSKDGFHTGQGTELLRFFGEICGLTLQRHLRDTDKFLLHGNK